MNLWRRLVEWDKRVSRRLGLRFDDPNKAPEENIRLAQRRRRLWKRPPIVSDASDFMTFDEAKEALQRAPGTGSNTNLLIGRGLLQHCFLEDGTEGLTASSVASEIEWRATASPWRRFTRTVGGIFHWV
jgi:hypothetical protein